ncbi:MAG: CCA tRNA nucleotidyltransferase [Rhodobacteraceae bacterium]|jgi:poly(A) polymerase|nr:CCA tRNA nucleotidyltransferase [Paracoccaceae bacterium]
MRIAGDWLARPATQAVAAMLTGAGHRALFVGGCVRNTLLGVAVSDVDIATDAPPAEVTDLARAAGLHPVPTGIEHGTVTVVSAGVPHEVTTFRRDVSTDGRRAVVAYTADVAEDAARRDFTMNALYATPDGTLVDPLGGLSDLIARRVRFVGEAAARIAEDYLRILRFFRFHAWYADPAGGIDPEGLAACAAGADGLGTLSRERVTGELRRLLAAADPAPAVAAMAAAGVLGRVLPGAGAEALAPLVALEGSRVPDWRRRLAVMAPMMADADLRLSRADATHLEALGTAVAGDAGLAEIAWRNGARLAEDAALVRAARAGAPLPPGWEGEVARGAGAVFPLRAADLMPPLSGPALGSALKAAERRWIDSGFTLTREALRGGAAGGAGRQA